MQYSRNVKCCRCRNIHQESAREWLPNKGGGKSSCCPRCCGISHFMADPEGKTCKDRNAWDAAYPKPKTVN